MRKLPWGWIVPLVLIVALALTARAYASAMGVADAAAIESARLDSIVRVTQAQAAQLTQSLGQIDAANLIRAQQDSVRIGELEDQNTVLVAQFDSLVTEDAILAEGVDDAVSDLASRLDEVDMPALRRVTGAYETRLMGFRSQVSVLIDQVRVVTMERDISREDADRARTGRSAADALVAGLRTTITVQASTIDSRDVEISSLRNAVAPSFFTRLGQNIGLVTVTAAIAAGLTLILTL